MFETDFNFNEQEANEILEDFILDLKVLVQDHGQKKIRDILMQLEPGLLPSNAPVQDPANLQENRGAPNPGELGFFRRQCAKIPPGKLTGKLKTLCNFVTGAGGAIGSVVGGAVGGVTSLAGTAGLTALGRQWDQDVNIADQEIDLKVVNPSLEKMVAQTNDLLQGMIDLLASTSKEQDDNLDYLSSAITGDSVTAIKGAQATISPEAGGAVADIFRTPSRKRGEEKDEPKPKSKKKED